MLHVSQAFLAHSLVVSGFPGSRKGGPMNKYFFENFIFAINHIIKTSDTAPGNQN